MINYSYRKKDITMGETTQSEQDKLIAQLLERVAGLENALLKLNEMYNKHIAGLHVQRIG
jgi:hypothetical protein